MVRHYFLFAPKPPAREVYNPLQKHAYTSAIALGAILRSLVLGRSRRCGRLGRSRSTLALRVL